MGDTYSSSGGLSKPEHLKNANVGATKSGNQRGIRYLSKNINIENGTKKFGSRKAMPQDKCLCQIPSRFAIEMTNRGWILRNEIIWKKPNCMPSSVKDRFTVDFEKLFFFVKSKKYLFKTQYEPLVKNSDMIYRKNLRVGRHYIVKEPYKNNISYHKNMDIKGQTPHSMHKDRINRNPNSWDNPLNYNSNGRNKRCVWNINTKPYKEAHFATYPKELCITPIQAGCPEKGIVLDPFFGSGTTGLVAQELKRNWIGIEINSDYIKIANERLRQHPML